MWVLTAIGFPLTGYLSKYSVNLCETSCVAEQQEHRIKK